MEIEDAVEQLSVKLQRQQQGEGEKLEYLGLQQALGQQAKVQIQGQRLEGMEHALRHLGDWYTEYKVPIRETTFWKNEVLSFLSK